VTLDVNAKFEFEIKLWFKACEHHARETNDIGLCVWAWSKGSDTYMADTTKPLKLYVLWRLRWR